MKKILIYAFMSLSVFGSLWAGAESNEDTETEWITCYDDTTDHGSICNEFRLSNVIIIRETRGNRYTEFVFPATNKYDDLSVMCLNDLIYKGRHCDFSERLNLRRK